MLRVAPHLYVNSYVYPIKIATVKLSSHDSSGLTKKPLSRSEKLRGAAILTRCARLALCISVLHRLTRLIQLDFLNK